MPISRNQFMRMLDDNEEPLAVRVEVGHIVRTHQQGEDLRRHKPIRKRGTWLSTRYPDEFNRLYRLCNELIDRGVGQSASVCTRIEKSKKHYHDRSPHAVRRGPSQRVRFQSREQIRLIERAAAARGLSFNAWATQTLAAAATREISERGANFDPPA